MKKILLSLLAISTLAVNAQEKKAEPTFGIKFGGFVKTDAFYDTRQTVNIREGHFLLYPDAVSKDASGLDLNDVPNFNMLSIQSRLKGAISGPDAFGAKTSGVLEADFFGNANSSFDDVNGFRLRHAFVKLNWTKAELLMGQYWHPMFVAESFPGTLSFNTGVPFQPFSRNPQIRFSYNISNIKFIATAFSQRDFVGIGPEYTLDKTTNKYVAANLASSKYLRNSSIPNLDFQVQFNPDSTEHLFGVGVDYKSILPELFTINNAKTKKFESNTTLNSLSGICFAKFKFKPITIKVEAVYAQNAYDMTMIGGYAVKQINDTATGAKDFSNLNTGSLWLDVNTNGKKVQVGLFAGYTKNMGSEDDVNGTFYARGSNIDNVFRVAPRVNFISGKFEVGLELEHTIATYGAANKQALVKANRDAVSNTRALLAFVYKF